VDILARIKEGCFGDDVPASAKTKDHSRANDSGKDRAIRSIEEGQNNGATYGIHHEFVLHIAMVEGPAKAQPHQLKEEEEERQNEKDRTNPAKHRREARLDEVKDVL
jgi:hypothetical protein